MHQKRQQKKSKTVSATELAQMGVCERLVVFEHRHGQRRARNQRASIRRGLDEHDRFYREAVRLSERKGRCYIATLAFGPGSETAALRRFRDRILRPHPIGRRLIVAYYRTAPAICTVLEHCPSLQAIVKTVLRPIVWMADRTLCDKGDDHDR